MFWKPDIKRVIFLYEKKFILYGPCGWYGMVIRMTCEMNLISPPPPIGHISSGTLTMWYFDCNGKITKIFPKGRINVVVYQDILEDNVLSFF